jgi:hypothetical protein
MVRNPINDPSNDERFPCEYCYAQISTNDWASHTVNEYYLKKSSIYFSSYYRKFVLREMYLQNKIIQSR